MRRIILPGEAPVYEPDPRKLNALELFLEYRRLEDQTDNEIRALRVMSIDWCSKAAAIKEEAQKLCMHEFGPQQVERIGRVSKAYKICQVCELRVELGNLYSNREAAMRSLRRQIRTLKALIRGGSYNALRLAEWQRQLRELEAEKNRIKFRL